MAHTAHTLNVEINKLEEEFDWLGRYICFDSKYCLAFLGKLEIRSYFFKKFPNFFQHRHTKQTSKDAYTIVGNAENWQSYTKV